MSGEQQRRGASELSALKDYIVRSLDIKKFYEARIGRNAVLNFKSDGWSHHVHCPIHNDSGKPNLSVNNVTGGFKCFSCGAAGSIFDFWCFVNGLNPKANDNFRQALVAVANEANVDIGSIKGELVANKPIDATETELPDHVVKRHNKTEAADNSRTPIKKSVWEGYIERLAPEHYEYLLFERGLEDATIKRYNIGWNHELKFKDRDGSWKKGKFTIPIFCKEKLCRNIRVYARGAPGEYKMINTKPYGSPARIFPLHELIERKPTNIIFCEGEWDCMLLNQVLDKAGLSDWLAITNTGGCNTFEPEWIDHFFDKNVYIIFDVDPAGKTWAASHAATHFTAPLSSGKIKRLKIITLPLSGSKDENDITDYFVKAGFQFKDLIDLIEYTPDTIVGGVNNQDATIEAIEVEDFVSCIKDRRYIDQRVRVPLTISGQSTKLYHATRSMRVVSCPLMEGGECCSSNAGIQVIPYGDTLFIESCMLSRKQLKTTLQEAACSKYKPCTVEEIEKVIMQEYFAHQVIKRLANKEDNGEKLVNQELHVAPIYILQPENSIDIGPQNYIATGFVRSHPNTRHATLFVETLEPMEEDWSQFKVDEYTKTDLKVIQEYPNVKALMEDLTKGVTQIYESEDILLTVLLTFLSPLRYGFNGGIINGWINSCILGDSGTGKSATYIRISDWLGIGDLFSALSGTRTGLLYSIKQKGVEWYVQIGRYVMASRKIIAVDETQEIPAEEIKRMANAMDLGWLEVSQVATGGYRTETRTLFLMNPKAGKKISDFSYGCQAITECFDPMFIRRLDIAIFTSGKDDYKFYNQKNDGSENLNIKIEPKNLRSLVYWAWTRTVNDIHWTEEATCECLNKAIELSQVYGHSDDIPLVNPQDFRNNLARLSTAFAVLSGSFTKDYTGLIVLPEHVIKMSMFIDAVYSSSSCNLKQYSKMSGKKKRLINFETIRDTINRTIDHAKNSPDERWREGCHFLQLLIMMQSQHYIRKRDLCEQLGVSMRWVQKHINILTMHDLIEIYRSGYKVTRKFNLFMQKWQEDPEVDELLSAVHEKVGKFSMQENVEQGGFSEYYGGRNSSPEEYEFDPFS